MEELQTQNIQQKKPWAILITGAVLLAVGLFVINNSSIFKFPILIGGLLCLLVAGLSWKGKESIGVKARIGSSKSVPLGIIIGFIMFALNIALQYTAVYMDFSYSFMKSYGHIVFVFWFGLPLIGSLLLIGGSILWRIQVGAPRRYLVIKILAILVGVISLLLGIYRFAGIFSH